MNKNLLVALFVAVIVASSLAYFGRVYTPDDEPTLGSSSDGSANVPDSTSIVRLIAHPYSVKDSGDIGGVESLVPKFGHRNDDAIFHTSSLRCRDPLLADPFCGDRGLGILTTDELQDLAAHGDAIALHFLGMRNQGTDPQLALQLYADAVIHGSAHSLGNLAHLLAEIASKMDADDALRGMTVMDAYAHRIAGLMLGYGANGSSLRGLHTEVFPNVPVSSNVCTSAIRLVGVINNERQNRGMRHLTVYLGSEEVQHHLRDTYGYCT